MTPVEVETGPEMEAGRGTKKGKAAKTPRETEAAGQENTTVDTQRAAQGVASAMVKAGTGIEMAAERGAGGAEAGIGHRNSSKRLRNGFVAVQQKEPATCKKS